MYVFVDGTYYSEEQAKVSVFDHGFLYGDGVFDDMIAYNGKFVKLDEHVDRFFRSAHAIKLEIPYSKEEIKSIIQETFRKSDVDAAHVRIIVTRGAGYTVLDPRVPKKPTVVAIAYEYKPVAEPKGLKMIIASTRKPSSASVDPRIKSLNYLSNVLARIEAIEAGVDDAIMLDYNDHVAECPGSNICVVKNGVLYSPFTANALEGITFQIVLKLATGNGYRVQEKDMTPYDLYTADDFHLFYWARSSPG